MFTNALLGTLLMILPVVTAQTTVSSGGDEDRRVERIVVTHQDEDVRVEAGEPLVIRVGSRGFIGVTLVEITPDLRAHYGAPRDSGVLVSSVEADTPAAKAGIQVGDVITSVDGESVEWTGDVSRAVRDKKAGEAVELQIVRDRAPRKVTVSVEERKGRTRTIDLGDLPRGRHGWLMRDLEKGQPLLERIEELEKRLADLEKKMGSALNR